MSPPLQMAKLPYFHSFGLFSNEPLNRLADRLLKLAPAGMARAIFCSSGSEANDTQIKVVRRYNNLLGRPAKKKIIARLGELPRLDGACCQSQRSADDARVVRSADRRDPAYARDGLSPPPKKYCDAARVHAIPHR